MNAPNLSPGSVVAGKYQIRSLMGHTGASATYNAVATAGGYEVALKLFSPAVAQRPDVMQMIEHIYGATNGLAPELIVPIIDAGYDQATGAPFGATQIVPMSSLAELVRRRPLSPAEVASILRAVSKVLDNAHIREIMHHALKPTNIFVDPAQGMAVRVMDFGANIPRSVVPTHEGYAHSAPWMAPEQVTGASPPGPGADVFSTALVAFYALTGFSYWRSCQGPAPDMNAWQQEVMQARTPASARASELGLRVSANLDSVFARALAHEPRDRFRTMGELASAFEGAIGSREPEMASTMAFPAVSDGPMGGAPQMGGYGPPPGVQQGGPGGQQGHSGDAGYPPPPVPYTGQAAYTATIPSSTMAVAPNQAPQPLPQRSASGKLAPILVGVVALLLVGGGAFAWVMLGRTPPPEPGPIAIATPQSSVSPSGVAAAPSAAPTPEPAASAAPSAAPAAPPEMEAKITCSPACEEITIDDKKVEDLSKPIMLTAGQHKISLSKSGYKPVNDTITIVDGKPFTKDYKLASSAPAVAVAAPPPTKPAGGGGTPTRKCGKLIKTNCTK